MRDDAERGEYATGPSFVLVGADWRKRLRRVENDPEVRSVLWLLLEYGGNWDIDNRGEVIEGRCLGLTFETTVSLALEEE